MFKIVKILLTKKILPPITNIRIHVTNTNCGFTRIFIFSHIQSVENIKMYVNEVSRIVVINIIIS